MAVQIVNGRMKCDCVSCNWVNQVNWPEWVSPTDKSRNEYPGRQWTHWRMARMLSEGDFYYRIAKVCAVHLLPLLLSLVMLCWVTDKSIFSCTLQSLWQCGLQFESIQLILLHCVNFSVTSSCSIKGKNVVALCDQGDKHKTGEQSYLKVNTW